VSEAVWALEVSSEAKACPPGYPPVLHRICGEVGTSNDITRHESIAAGRNAGAMAIRAVLNHDSDSGMLEMLSGLFVNASARPDG
jgi:hypothetical protein